MAYFSNKTVLVTGGTGSIGRTFIHRLLSGSEGKPKKIIVFSRDENKQHQMRLEYENYKKATYEYELIYNNYRRLIEFQIGDVTDYHAVCAALKKSDIVINAAALKQVPNCEYFPYEAVQTNIGGAENIIRALREHDYPVKTVLGISTDKACKPIGVMGMTKALSERLWIAANLSVPQTRFICVRFGNVLASRGSVLPLFLAQIERGGPVTITDPTMTRFLLPLEEAIDLMIAALKNANPGEIYLPKIKSTSILNLAKALIGKRDIKIVDSGIRPGEKIHEPLIAEEEAWRTVSRGKYFVIQPILPELTHPSKGKKIPQKEFVSSDNLMNLAQTEQMLKKHHLTIEECQTNQKELLR